MVIHATFPLGEILATQTAVSAVSEDDMASALNRHAKRDWGELPDEDIQLNDYAVKNGARILSAYKDRNGVKFWIITEADRSATTILLTEDY